MRPEGELPPIIIEDFAEERVRRTRPPVLHGHSAIALHPPGYEIVARLAAVVATVKQDYARTIGTHRDFSPRLHSRVEHRIGQRADDALAALSRSNELTVSAGPLRLVGDPSRTEYDGFEHEYRMPCRLHLPWSWPELPMWLAVGEVSATKGALRLSLRSRRRVRYPARYFHSAHAVLNRLEARLR